MYHSTHGNSDGHHWYADFIILCFLVTHFKDLSQAHTIVYLKKYNSKIPTFTPSLLNQNIESLSTICRLQENKMLQKTAITGRQPVWSFGRLECKRFKTDRTNLRYLGVRSVRRNEITLEEATLPFPPPSPLSLLNTYYPYK